MPSRYLRHPGAGQVPLRLVGQLCISRGAVTKEQGAALIPMRTCSHEDHYPVPELFRQKTDVADLNSLAPASLEHVPAKLGLIGL